MPVRSARRITALIALAATTGACQPKAETAAAPAAPAMIAEADAAKIADATEAAWTSMDAAKIKALYAPGIVGFDLDAPPLSTDRATWDKWQDAFAAAKLDKAERKQRRIQVLDADTFVLSGVWDMRSSSTPKNDAVIRCTDVFEKAADGSWPIVNEHCSEAPKA